MLKRFEVINYRGFKRYRMEGLARVNLLVGRNNSGKTAVLEGLEFLTSGGDPAALVGAAMRRGEVQLPRAQSQESLIDIAHFFHGHVPSLDTPFTVQGENGVVPVSVRIVNVHEERRSDRASATEPVQRATMALKIEGGQPSDRAPRFFPMSPQGGVDLDPEFRVPRFRRGEARARTTGVPVRFVSAESLDMPPLAGLWDEVQLAAREQEVADALRIIEPEIRSVHFLTGMFAFGYVGRRAGVVVGLPVQPERVPLGSLGEGMRRLLAMSISLVASSNGFLLVDEIDTGLHYSIMADMWKLVVRTAVANNIQVFGTTHSSDCVNGLAELCQREPDLMQHVAVHKLDRELSASVPIAGDELVGAVASGIELR